MKKLYTLAVLSCFALAGTAQVQRTVLAEGFSNASCGPCASQNPGYNAVIAANPTKIIAIKFQASFPGFDPMNQDNPTEAASRLAYYGVNGVPMGFIDGVAIANDCNGYLGALGCLAQADVDAAYAVSSPFSVDVSHTFNAALDTVHIQVIITAEQNITNQSDLVSHVVLTEKHINFATAPGSNGEKNFYHVMRKMVDGNGGTSLAANWTSGDADTLEFTIALPTYVTNKAEVEVVAYVQRTTSKVVHQAAVSHPVALPNYATNAGITTAAFICSQDINSTFSLSNTGSTVITSGTLNYKLDNGVVQTTPWTGSIAIGATGTIPIPAFLAVAAGTHTVTAYMTAINGSSVSTQSMPSVKSLVISAAPAAPIAQSFTTPSFPPTGWGVNQYGSTDGWSRQTPDAYGGTTGSARCYFYAIPGGEIRDLYSMRYDLTGIAAPYLKFSMAYAPYNNNYIDGLKVMASTDCGQNWDELFSGQTGTGFNTAAATTASFAPTNAQWRDEILDLSTYLNESELLIQFQGLSGYGNNLFVDEINIANNFLSIENNDINLGVFPNPAVDNASLSFYSPEAADAEMSVINMLGEIVYTKSLGKVSGSQSVGINTTDFSAGTYMVKLNIAGQTFTERLVVVK